MCIFDLGMNSLFKMQIEQFEVVTFSSGELVIGIFFFFNFFSDITDWMFNQQSLSEQLVM